MDKLRNDLYDEFRPQIQMHEEIQINDGTAESFYPFVATKKVTQMRILPAKLPQDNQLEVLPIEQNTKEVLLPNLPPIGPLVKLPPEADSIVYIMKHSLMPWIRAKVLRNIYILFIYNNSLSVFHYARKGLKKNVIERGFFLGPKYIHEKSVDFSR